MHNRGQTIIEYAVIIAIVTAALLAMQVYYKRSLMGRVRGYADQLGDGSGYAPRATNSASLTKRMIIENGSTYSEDGFGDGFKNSVSETNTSISQNTTKTEEVSSYEDE